MSGTPAPAEAATPRPLDLDPLKLDPLDLAALEHALAGTAFAGHVQHFAEIGSTSTHAMQAGAAGAAHGSVYVADAQNAGRGRGAHQWASPAGSGLYVSVLLRPALAPGDAVWLTLAAGLAAARAVRETSGLALDIRWPNDLMAGPRKLGGILTEMQAEATRVRFVVIGIGINVHQREFPAELAGSATSLAIATGRKNLSRTALLAELLYSLAREAEALAADDITSAVRSIHERMEAHSTWVRGRRVTVGEDAAFSGVTEGLDARGFLRVRTDAGELRVVRSGGVRGLE